VSSDLLPLPPSSAHFTSFNLLCHSKLLNFTKKIWCNFYFKLYDAL
jgi:hypothetical protein